MQRLQTNIAVRQKRHVTGTFNHLHGSIIGFVQYCLADTGRDQSIAFAESKM